MWAVPMGAQAEQACWHEITPDVLEWRCANLGLPVSGQSFALSVYVVGGADGLLVLDSGVTASVGRLLGQQIRARFGVGPWWVLNSQPKPDHVLGNIGLSEACPECWPGGIEHSVVAGALTAELMALRCPRCIDNLAKRMGEASISGTQPVIPKTLLPQLQGDLSLLNARFAQWRYTVVANVQTEEAVVLHHPSQDLVWVGSLVEASDAPDLYDGAVERRIQFLKNLQARFTANTRLLSSTGELNRQWVGRNLAYFEELRGSLLQGLKSGATEVELIGQHAGQPGNGTTTANEHRDRTQEIHSLNVQRILRQLETLAFESD